MPRHHSLAAKCFLVAAHCIRRLPNFRGKVRALMELYRLLGFEKQHIDISTVLHHPIPFHSKLDLFSKHERMAFFMNAYEPDTVEFLMRLWQPGEAFVDVGANIGLIAIPFSLLCNARSGMTENAGNSDFNQTYCIEAVAANQAGLATNIEMNGLGSRIHIIQSAVGEREKDVEIQIEGNQKSGEGTGTANILGEGSQYSCERVPLHVTTIDRLAAEEKLPKQCGVLKIDIDGYDLFALMGAKSFLESTRPIIFGEFNAHCLSWHQQTILDVQNYLAPLGFKVYSRRNDWSFGELGDVTTFVQDAICVPEEKIDRLRWCLV